MRTYIFRTKHSIKKECLKKFPDGKITRQDRQTNRGLFLWMSRNMGRFNNAYEYTYGKKYRDIKSLIARPYSL